MSLLDYFWPKAPAPEVSRAPVAMCPDAAWAEYEQLLTVREGKRNTVYLDSLGKPTVGIGHLVRPEDNLKRGDMISDAQVSAFFKADGGVAMQAAVDQAAEAGITDPAFLPYLASVNFQLGPNWTDKFPNTWKTICRGSYNTAAGMLAVSEWRKQTPVRVADFQEALRRLPPKA